MLNRTFLISVLSMLATFALVLWAGATWTAGYVFAPVLFTHYPSALAGDIAGQLFNAVNILSIVCAMVILLDLRVRFTKQLHSQSDLAWLLVLIFCVLIQYLGFSPKMAELKLHFPDAQAMSSFGKLHGFSQIVYLLQSLGLAWLVWRRFRRI